MLTGTQAHVQLFSDIKNHVPHICVGIKEEMALRRWGTLHLRASLGSRSEVWSCDEACSLSKDVSPSSCPEKSSPESYGGRALLRETALFRRRSHARQARMRSTNRPATVPPMMAPLLTFDADDTAPLGAKATGISVYLHRSRLSRTSTPVSHTEWKKTSLKALKQLDVSARRDQHAHIVRSLRQARLGHRCADAVGGEEGGAVRERLRVRVGRVDGRGLHAVHQQDHIRKPVPPAEEVDGHRGPFRGYVVSHNRG